MLFHGGDIVYLFNTRSKDYIYAKTQDFYDITNLHKVLQQPTYGPDITLAQQFQVLIVTVPPLTLTGHGPRDRIRDRTDTTGPVTAGTAFRLLRISDNRPAQFLTIMQHGSDETFASTNRYNLTVTHRTLVAYTTAADNTTGNLYIASSGNAFAELSILTFYNKVAMHIPQLHNSTGFALEPSVNEPVDEFHDPQWSIVLANVAVLRGCVVKSTAGMTISPEATDSNGDRVFRTAEECNEYRYAYPEDFVVGWQCVNTGGNLGVNRCVSVTQYTTNDRQPLFGSAGTCLAKCDAQKALTAPSSPTSKETVTAPTTHSSKESTAPMGPSSKESAARMGPSGTDENYTIIIILIAVFALVFVLICVLIWKKQHKNLISDGGT